ncbi:MAG: hypothetical protein R3B07_16635 [Polyangiaceae bacterium]
MSERERSSRFSVYVPSPKVRLNMGLPIYKPEDGVGTFGYTGMSLQSDRHLFIDVNKVALYQSGSHSMWQVGGKWLQYSNANMVMACTASNMVAASAKVVIAAGAGHGQITALDHAQPHVTPRMVDYNNLDLHYRVEEVHNGVRQLMYGDGWKTARGDSQDTQFEAYVNGYSGGLLKDLHDQFVAFGDSLQEARASLQPLEWEGNYVEMKNGFPPGADSSVYPAFKAFDPYPAAGFRNPGPAKTFGHFLQTVNFFHRFVDVLGKVGPLITDNFIGSRIQNLINIWGNAQEGFQSAMNVGDFVRWDQNTGDTGFAMTDEFGNVAARPGNAENFGSGGASLTSVPELYDLTGLSGTDLDIKVYDSEGNSKTLTLVNADVACPSASVTPATNHEAIVVTVTNPSLLASIKVGGKPAYRTDAGSGFAWNVLPDGFEATGDTIKRKDGALFAATNPVNCTFASSASGAISVEIDGTTKSIDLATLVAASDRAQAVATALGSFATKSGTSVTIASATTGTGSTIKIPTDDDESKINLAKKWLGISGRINNAGAAKGTAAWLAAQLNTLGLNYAASAGSPEDLGSDVCTVAHNSSGSSAYLKITGGPTSRLFGEDPAIAQGKDEGFYKNFQDVRVLQFEIAKWPEDVRNLFRPVIEAMKDVMAVYDRIKGIIDEALALAGLSLGPPSAIGMFAGDGITIGAGGKLFGVADGITLISTPKGDPDEDKFAMGPVEKWLVKAQEWDPLQEYWKNRDAGHPFQVPKKDGHKTSGIRIVSNDDVFMASRFEMRLTSLRYFTAEAPFLDLTSAESMTLSVREGEFGVHAKTINLGVEADFNKQKATEWIRMVSKEKVELKSEKATMTMDNDKIHLGGRGDQAFAGKLDKPRVYVSTKSGSEAVGIGTDDNSGQVGYGLIVESNANPTLTGKSELSLAAGGSGITVKGAGVEVTGQFKVGPEFVVKASGKLSPATVVKSVLAQHPRAMQLKPEYTALMTQAKALLAAADGVISALEAAEKSRALAILPPTRLAADKAMHLLQEQFVDMKAELADLNVDRNRLIAEAKLYDVDDAALGRKEPDDTDVFYEH